VFWDFEDIHSIEPVLVLSSPLEIISFEFNPKDPNIVVGGAMNGQVMLWDLSGSPLFFFSSKKQGKSKQEKSDILRII
jgi:WD40 repeat protein